MHRGNVVTRATASASFPVTGEQPKQSGAASGRTGSQANDPDRLLASASSRNQLIGLGLMVVGLITILAAIFLIHNGCT
jgi:hypothetical protein